MNMPSVMSLITPFLVWEQEAAASVTLSLFDDGQRLGRYPAR